MEENNDVIGNVKNLYSVIANKELGDSYDNIQTRVNIIKELERLTKQEFLSTADFHQKVNEFIINQKGLKSNGAKFKEARIKSGMTQEQLAELLGVSIRSIKHWEAGTRSLSKAGFKWLNLTKGEQK